MPFQPAPGTAEVRVHYTQDLQNVYNIYHAFIGTGWSTELLNDLAIDVRTAVEALLAVQSDNLQLIDITATDISTVTGGQVTILPTGDGVGQSTGAHVPNHVTVVVKWTTALRGRSYRGRTYHLGLTDVTFDTNTLTQTAVGDLEDLYQGVLDALNQLPEREACVLSRYNNNILREEAICTPIVGFTVEPTVDSQRRRLPGRGS